MLSLTTEIEALRERGAIDPARAETLLRIERREVFSIHYETRVAAYLAIAMIATAVGAILKNNLDRIGPLTIVVVLAAAAAALYVYAFAQRRRGTFTIFTEYLALLAALLISADAGYAEQQFDLLGRNGFDHLLVLAAFHALVAYALQSKLVLSLSLTSLVAWFGIDRTLASVIDAPSEIGQRALLCAAAIVVWRVLHSRFSAQRELDRTFEHFIVNLFGVGMTAFVVDKDLELFGIVLLVIFVVGVGGLAVKRRSELFLLYTLFHGMTALGILIQRHLAFDILKFFLFLLLFIGAIATLFIAHMRWRFDQ